MQHIWRRQEILWWCISLLSSPHNCTCWVYSRQGEGGKRTSKIWKQESLSELIQEQCYVTDDCIKSSILLHAHSFTIQRGAFKCSLKKSKICVQMREDTYRISSARSLDKNLILFTPVLHDSKEKTQSKTLLVEKKLMGKNLNENWHILQYYKKSVLFSLPSWWSGFSLGLFHCALWGPY